MVERYSVGRRYTRRERIGADCFDLDGMRAVLDAVAGSSKVQRRLVDLKRGAIAHLKHDPKNAIDRDRAWLRANERNSLEWYALEILAVIGLLQRQIRGGDIWPVVNSALELGVLAAEAKMIEYMASNPAEGGKAKASQHRRAGDDRIAIYRQQAVEKWRKNPALKASEVARYIKGPKEGPQLKPNYIRKQIADLDPKKR